MTNSSFSDGYAEVVRHQAVVDRLGHHLTRGDAVFEERYREGTGS